MIKVGVFYPLAKKFDWDYYLAKHTPMIKELLSPALKKVDIEEGLAGGGPGAPATYTTICNLHFDSVEAFQEGLRAARAGDHERHRELHRRAACGADQRGEDVGLSPARQRR
jgi:uncharacterized protein (TIGR02118 family)